MAVVDVIDLTVSSPSPSVIVIADDDVDQPTSPGSHKADQEKRRQRQRDEEDRVRYDRYRERRDNQWGSDTWHHDRFFDDDLSFEGMGMKRKRHDVTNAAQSSRGRARSLTPPLFTVDTTGRPSILSPLQQEHLSRDPVSTHFVVKTLVQPLPGPPIEHSGERGLLLPDHVTVSSQDYAPGLHEDPQLPPNSEASGIDFLDDDRTVGAPRYFHDSTTYTKSTRSRGPCTHCGDNDHDFKTCPNTICMTCGARNEHGSRSCPILRFCWRCRAKGHLAKDCPLVGEIDLRQLNRQDCDRCGSWKHHGTNCPSLWRIYTYLTDEERDDVLTDRESKSHLDFDNGGEGYIARDRWCYNCGGSGHFGDDCDRAGLHDRPDEYSAFGSFNELSGPFASPSSAVPKIQRPPRSWEEGGQFDDGHGFFAEGNVGKKSRENTKAKAREAQRLLEEENDETDWFSMNRAGLTEEKADGKRFSEGRSKLPHKPAPPTIELGFRNSSVSQVPVELGSRGGPHSRPSLQDHIDVDDRRPREILYKGDRGKRRERGRGEKRGGVHGEERERDRGDKRERDRGDKRERDCGRRDGDARDRGYDEPLRERGSRWRGGYDR